MILLDTDFIIDLTKKKETAIKKLEEISNEALAISSITLAELYYGAVKQNQEFAEEKFAQYFILPFDRQEAISAAKIRVQLEKNGGRIGPEDEMIAATALTHNAAILTRNTRHFKRVFGIKVETW